MTFYNDSGNVTGQKSVWEFKKKLGEGDAGEVFLVEAVSEEKTAILKRPQRSVFMGDVRRQADQIRIEGRILRNLSIILNDLAGKGIYTPKLLDQSKPGTEFSDRYFIVIERAAGFDLAFLAKVSRMGLQTQNDFEISPGELALLEHISKTGKIPERILLKAVDTIFSVFEKIHSIDPQTTEVESASILWNDVKPDHLFWNPVNSTVTIIDWGNGQINEADAVERNLRHSPLDDQRQFLDEMDRFLAMTAPELHLRLKWPEKIPGGDDFQKIYEGLKKRARSQLAAENKKLHSLIKEETDLNQPKHATDQSISRLDEIHNEQIALGVIPDYEAALRLVSGVTATLAAAGELDRVRQLCHWASVLPGVEPEFWQLLAKLAGAAIQSPVAMQKLMAEAVKSAAVNDWENVLWIMMEALNSNQEPDWWYELTREIRFQVLGKESQIIPPLLYLRRLNLTLQANSQQLEDRLAHSPAPEGEKKLTVINALIETVKSCIQNWIQVDPMPPYSGIGYGEIERILGEIEKCIPGGGTEMQRVLALPGEQLETVLNSWGRKEFINAGRGLRRLLVLDPDRRRLLRADKTITLAPTWLSRIQNGPSIGEHLADFATDLEYEGRELRNEVGSAGWLDGILEGLKAIRQGMWPGDLLAAQPVLLNEMPWLRKFVRNEVLAKVLNPNSLIQAVPSILGVRDTRYGPENELSFVEPLDAWMPEARGSSARVYLAAYRTHAGEQRDGAIKLMRMDKVDYSLPLFREEIKVLNQMDDVFGVARLLESGFLWMGGDEGRLPLDHEIVAIKGMHGDVLRIGPDSSDQFLDILDKRVEEGWTPYLLIEKRKREESLLTLCDASLNHGRFQSMPDLLFISIQICDILQAAHERNVVYRDHKILHYYWQPENNGVSIIDWNVAKFHPDGITPFDIHMDLVQLGARGLHHVLCGRTAPGALPLGPTRPEEIEHAAQSYAAQWTYDDQRLSGEVKTIMEQLLSGSYTRTMDLKEDLKRAYMHLVND